VDTDTDSQTRKVQTTPHVITDDGSVGLKQASRAHDFVLEVFSPCVYVRGLGYTSGREEFVEGSGTVVWRRLALARVRILEAVNSTLTL
jgi:hypothetical protein